MYSNKSLSSSSLLVILFLFSIKQGDDGAAEIGEALKLNPTLSTINLLGNPVWEL